MTDDESNPNDKARRLRPSSFELRQEKAKSAGIMSEAKRVRRIPRPHLKAFATGSLGPSRTGVIHSG
jgi:hypothetical protein